MSDIVLGEVVIMSKADLSVDELILFGKALGVIRDV